MPQEGTEQGRVYFRDVSASDGAPFEIPTKLDTANTQLIGIENDINLHSVFLTPSSLENDQSTPLSGMLWAAIWSQAECSFISINRHEVDAFLDLKNANRTQGFSKHLKNAELKLGPFQNIYGYIKESIPSATSQRKSRLSFLILNKEEITQYLFIEI